MTEETKATEPLTEEQIKAQMTEAVASGDWGTVKKLAAELDKLAKAEAARAKAELQSKLEQLSTKVKEIIGKALTKLIDSGELDGADGIWYARDFNAGDLVEVRLLKKKASTGEGGSAGKSSYIVDPRKSADMLNVIGEQVMFAEDTVVTIDKQEHTMPAGTTLKQAYDYSTNGGWRNRVRMAILKAMG